MKKWQTVSSKVIFEHPRLTLVEDEVELPDGNQVSYLKYGNGKDAVTILAEGKDGILISREYSYPPDEILWQFPGGGVESGESVIAAAKRELIEETGALSDSFQEIGWYYPNNRRSNARTHVIVATDVVMGQQRGTDAEEFIESEWKTVDEIERMMARGEVVNYSALAAWTFYKLTRL